MLRKGCAISDLCSCFVKHEHKEKDRRLNEQFINGINHDGMMSEIIKELTAYKGPRKHQLRP